MQLEFLNQFAFHPLAQIVIYVYNLDKKNQVEQSNSFF